MNAESSEPVELLSEELYFDRTDIIGYYSDWTGWVDMREPREVECKHCDGTGVDRRTGADCWNCYGDGTILLED